MAFDTVIDKAQLEAAMKATADAIREKTGDTANCTWDPAQGFAALIAAIESGGGSGGNLNGVWGLVTPASASLVTIEHGLGKRPVVWGFLYASSFNNVSEELCGHRTYIRQDAATGKYTKTVGSFSQPGWNNISTYTQYGTSTYTDIDTEESDELKVPYQQIYANKNFLKFNPQSTRGRNKIAVGDTYIWYVLGTD